MSDASAPGPSGPNEYEFSPDENVVLGELASAATTWGALCLVAAAGFFGAAAAGAAGLLPAGAARLFAPAGLFELSIGVPFLAAGRAFRKVTLTRGNDIHLTVRALGQISGAVAIQIAVAAAAALFVAAAAVLALRG